MLMVVNSCYLGVRTAKYWLVVCENKQITGAKSSCKHLSDKKIPWSESVSELYRPSDRRLSAKLVSTFADIMSIVPG
jgi:hypothetical protein